MRLKDQGKNSILLLNKSSVIAGALLLAVISIGLGYFIGFKTGQAGAPEVEQVIEKPVKVPEEKRVLELPPPRQPEDQQGAAPAQKNSSPEAVAHEGKSSESPQRGEQVERPPETGQYKGTSDKKSPNYWWIDKKTPEIQKTGRGDQDRNFNKQIGPNRDATAEDRQPNVWQESPMIAREQGRPSQEAKTETKKADNPEAQQAQPEKLPGPVEKKAVKQSPVKQKQYAIQFGAFPSRQGAEELKALLRSKGVNAYIVDKAKDDVYYRVRTGAYQNKKDADRQAVQLEKQTGLKGFVTAR